MSTFFKKRSHLDKESSDKSNKRQRLVDTESSKPLARNPKRIVCWNCNGLSVRLRDRYDVDSLKSFMRTYNPDILFLSEVRLPAAHNAGTRKPTSATTFYRSRMRDTDPAFGDLNQLLHSPECEHYKVYFSLADTKYAGTAMFVNTETTALPTSIRFNLKTLDVKRTVHDTDGRVIFAKFPGFSILHTYVPNNGWASGHFNRRREWDDAMKAFMQRKKDAGVNVMWLGDLNAAPTDEDLTHPSYFRKQVAKPGNARRGGGKADANVAPENIGQPGCTDGERGRFHDILSTGDLVDAYRDKNPNSGSSEGVFSWRGLQGGVMAGRGMRIDHCIASRSLLPHIVKVEVLAGTSPQFTGFMGSDHCPVLVTCVDGDVCESNGEGEVASDERSKAKSSTSNDLVHDVTGEIKLKLKPSDYNDGDEAGAGANNQTGSSIESSQRKSNESKSGDCSEEGGIEKAK